MAFYPSTPFPYHFINPATGALLSGGTIEAYLAGTSTPTPMYTNKTGTSAGSTVTLNSGGLPEKDGATFVIHLDSAIEYKFILKNASGSEIWPIDNITNLFYQNEGTVNKATIAEATADDSLAGLIGTSSPVRVKEYATGKGDIDAPYDVVAAGTGTHDGFLYHSDDGSADGSVFQLKLRVPEIVSALLAGVYPDGSTTNDTQAQVLLTNARVIRFPKGSSYYKFTTRLTVPADTTIYFDDAELRWTATVANGTNFLGSATRPGFEWLGSGIYFKGRAVIKGPSSAAYVSNEIGVYCKGTSSASRYEGFGIEKGIEFTQWGYAGLVMQFCDVIDVDGFKAYTCGHAGALLLSCDHGSALDVEVGNITPGDGANAYGFSLTHDSTDYDADANAGTKSADNPFCVDWEVTGTAYDIPLWRGFDAHGGYEIYFHHMKVYNCRYPIGLSSSSGDAAAYAGDNNEVSYCIVTDKRRDGSATTVSATDRSGIVVNGGSTVKNSNVRVICNVIDGYGDASNTSVPLECTNVQDAQIRGNIFKRWKGECISTTGGSGVMDGNIFGPVADATNSRCIRINSSSNQWNIVNNKLELNGGTAPAEGLRITSATVRHIVDDNNFDAATTPYVGTVQALSGAGAVDVINKTTHVTTTGVNALTLADGVEDQEKFIVMVADGGDGTLTPTNLYNGTTITFDDVGDSAYLKFTGGQWVFMGGTATLA